MSISEKLRFKLLFELNFCYTYNSSIYLYVNYYYYFSIFVYPLIEKTSSILQFYIYQGYFIAEVTGPT